MRTTLRSFMLAVCAVLALAGTAKADGWYNGPGGTGVFLSSRASCAATPAVPSCAFVSVFNYTSAGKAQTLTSVGNNVTSTDYGGTLREGAGSLTLTTPNPFSAALALNGGTATALDRWVIETGRPVGAFNTVRTDLYATLGATEPEAAFEVQGTTLFGGIWITLNGRSGWGYVLGAMTVDAHSVWRYEGDLVVCDVGPACGAVGRVNIVFPRNTEAVITGFVSKHVYPFIY
jgi:autotransporter-associated beta strand protein